MELLSAGWIFAFILIVSIAALSLHDLVPLLGTWLRRIHIGRYDQHAHWHSAVAARGAKWLNRTPVAKVTDQTRLTVIERLNGRYSASALQDWQRASLLLGLSELPEESGVKHEMERFLSTTFTDKGDWRNAPRHVDSAILAYAVMKIPGIQADRYRPALDAIRRLIEDHVGEDGTVRYRNAMREYRYVDTVGFICPFLIAYGMKFGDTTSLELAMKQIRAYVKFGFHEGLGIPAHAYDISSEAPLGLIGWGRGLGWFAIGLIDMWSELPSNHVYKRELRHVVKAFAEAVMKLQQPGGSWSWTVTRKESRPDSSATVTLAWFLIKAAELEELSAPAMKCVEKAMHYLRGVTRKDGAVEFSQGDTKDIGVYSTLFGILPFTQGFAIRLGQRYGQAIDGGSELRMAVGQREWSKP
ncbi:glycoside hydrolase family 88 protein [Paenibacillus sp. NPDC057967]|uniref:glycoside hydrolase family 88 protein n=1 Tax=Paenibacillus sp. NPDC057967 TaxID=3346293 RepID=UPI0036D851E1